MQLKELSMEKVVFNRLTIDKGVLTRENMDVGDFLFTLLYILGYRAEDLEDDMLKRETAKFEFGKVVPTLYTIARVKRIIASANAPEMSKEDMVELAKEMKAMFPKGFMMDGIPWTEGPVLIVQRLEGFIRRFGNYPAEDILKATERYVAAKRNTPYMKSLKNFIFKEVEQSDGTTDLQSDLYNFLENPDSLLNPLEDWTVELRD